MMKTRTPLGRLFLVGGVLAPLVLLPIKAQPPQPPADSVGSGFFVTSNGYFVTCCHVIKNAQDLLIRQGGRTWKATVAAFNVESDIALLKVETSTGFPCLPLDDPQNMALGSAVYAPGAMAGASGEAPKLVKGVLKAMSGPADDMRLLQVAVPTPAMSSGAPLLDQKGNVVGIMATAQNISLPIKSIYIDPLFDSIPDARNFLAAKVDTPADPKALEQQVTSALGCVMLPRPVAVAPKPVAAEPITPSPSTSTPAVPSVIAKTTVTVNKPSGDGDNLLKNGNFAHGLEGWRYKYDLPGEGWYTNNHNLVSVVAEAEGKPPVLKLHGTFNELMSGHAMGIKVDSDPVPFKPTERARLIASVRTTGPNCRILVYGYKWKPGVKPHPNPILPELRECYHSVLLYFTKPVASATAFGAGSFGGAKAGWLTASVVAPDSRTTATKGKTSALGQDLWNSVEFLSVHIVAIAGKPPGDLFVKDVRLEKVN